MAETHVADPVSDMDYPEHERTYHFFLGLLKFVLGGVVLVLILMAYFLV